MNAEGEQVIYFTRREREVLVEVGLGHRNSEIAANLGITPHTVSSYITLLMAKLRVRGRSHLAVYAALGAFPTEEALKARWLGEEDNG